jgi:hypothetical protein
MHEEDIAKLEQFIDRLANTSTLDKEILQAMSIRRNPAERADRLADENMELRAQLARISGIAETAGSIDSEDGLRRSLERIGSIVGVEDEADEEYDESPVVEESDEEEYEEEDDDEVEDEDDE